MLLGAWQIVLDCTGPCRSVQVHRYRVEPGAGRREQTVFTCRGCSATTRRVLTHLAYSRRATACGLAPERRVRRVSLGLGPVTCPECQVMFVQELAVLPEIDWRPAFSIAEDFLA